MSRVVLLVDMNAFFISCETARDPSLRGNPAAVAGDPAKRCGIILAPNYDARKYGIKTTMLTGEARKLCPGLVLVPPDHKYYSSMSRKVMGLLSDYTPVIQQNSIDEAWLDLTGCELLLGSPVKAAENIMKTILDRLGLWCSIGISENKFLSKMASEMKKPMGITELWKKDMEKKLWPLPIRDMYGIGSQTEQKLHRLSIFTIGDLATCSPKMLSKILGRPGRQLHCLANGIDPSPVTPEPEHESRSISRSVTLPSDISDPDKAKSVIYRLAEEVGAEARKHGLKGRTVNITMKYSDFSTITRQKSINPTNLTGDIYSTGVLLLESNWNTSRPVRLLGIGLGSIDEDLPVQPTLFDLSDTSNETREEMLEKTIDSIREKYGTSAIKRGPII